MSDEKQKKSILQRVATFFKDVGSAIYRGIMEAVEGAIAMFGIAFGQMAAWLLAMIVVLGAGALVA